VGLLGVNNLINKTMKYIIECYNKSRMISSNYIYENEEEIGVKEKKHLLNFAKMFISPQTDQIELKPIQ
jgi:hypothetical protein